MTFAAWAISDNEHLSVYGGARAVTISEWIPAMFWTGSCFQLAFPLLSNSLLELLHRSKASSHYWFLKLVPFGTSCTSADFYKQDIFQSFVEIWKECAIPHCLYFENKYTAVFSSTWQCSLCLFWSWQWFPIHDPGCRFPFLFFPLTWWYPSSETIRNLSCQTDLFLCGDTNEMKQAQAKSFHN